MSFKVQNETNEITIECDNCGSEDDIFSNSSGDKWCESCGWSEV